MAPASESTCTTNCVAAAITSSISTSIRSSTSESARPGKSNGSGRTRCSSPGRPTDSTSTASTSTSPGKFVLHCHILDHEDLGMMQVVQVLPAGRCRDVPVSTYERVREILDAAAGSAQQPSYAGRGGRFWNLPLAEFLEVTLYGVRLIAPVDASRGRRSPRRNRRGRPLLRRSRAGRGPRTRPVEARGQGSSSD